MLDEEGYPALREEIRASGERFRASQVETIERACAKRGLHQPLMTAPALAALMSAVARSIVIENNVGFSTTHDDVRRFVEATIDIYEA